jgi:hypothetical protein
MALIVMREFAWFRPSCPLSILIQGSVMPPSSSTAAFTGAASPATTPQPKEVNAMLRRLQEVLSGRNSGMNQQPRFNGRLLDQKREDVYVLMHQQMSSMR